MSHYIICDYVPKTEKILYNKPQIQNEVIKIRKVDLSMTEQEKYEIIKKLVETEGNKKRAALKIGCTQRHINRLIQRYKKEGKVAFIHGNRGRQPVHAIEKEKKELIVDFYRTKYYDANFEHFTELLEKYEGIKVSPSLVRDLLIKEQIMSPMAHRPTKKRLKIEYIVSL